MLDRRQFVAGLGTMAVTSIAARSAWAAGSIKIDDASALLVIDVQNCFLPGGSLAVKDGDQVVPVINRLAKGFANVVLTQDWHTAGHVSFASVHSGKKPFETIDLPYGKQVLWPDHCVQGTEGAGLSKDLSIPQAGLIIRKGYHQNVDSYSAFTEADGKTTTGLAAYLNARKLQRLFIAGLPRISASHGRRWMRGRRDLRPMSSKMPAVASTRRAHSPRPGRTWRRPASNASSRAISPFDHSTPMPSTFFFSSWPGLSCRTGNDPKLSCPRKSAKRVFALDVASICVSDEVSRGWPGIGELKRRRSSNGYARP